MTAAREGLPNRDLWRRLIGPALQVIDSLVDAGYGRLDFRLGGGTVLMFRFDHRFSKDIDVFTYDVQALGFLSPRLNALSAAIANSYQEQANTVKLVLPEGDIDFIVAAPVITDAAPETVIIDGRVIALESTAEILGKKLLYRGESFKARDVFDMAVVLGREPEAAHAALAATRHAHPALLRRLAAMQAVPEIELVKDLQMTETGERHAENMVERVRQAVIDVRDA